MGLKTVIVGLDAACWDYLDPLLRSGNMPTLKHFIDSGVWGTLHSTMPPWTPTAWSSIITGKNPGKHGIYDMLFKRPGSNRFTLTNATLRSGSPFWQTLNKNGIKTGLVNIPFTYPPQSLNGFLVCGFGTPNLVDQIAYPPEIPNWIRDNFPGFQPEVEAELLATASPEEIFSAEKQQQATFVEIAGQLVNRYKVDVLAINLMFPDHANHKMPQMEQVQEAYRQTDKDLARVVEMFAPDNVMIISDHGSSRLNGDFMLGAWLRDHGYYVTLKNTAVEASANFNWLLGHYFQDHLGWSGFREKIVRRLVKESFFFFPKSIQDRFWSKFEGVFPGAQEYLRWSGKPDYSLTKVFTGSVYSGLLYLNIAEFGDDGNVSAGQKKALVKEIATKLMDISDPINRKPLFTKIYVPEDIYEGPNVLHGPDLILDAYESGWNLRMRKDFFPSPPKSILDRYFVVDASQRDFGWHSREGIYVFSGTSFHDGGESADANVWDIPSTLLHLYDVPLPEDYDGMVQTEAMTSVFRERPIRYQASDSTKPNEKLYSPDEEESLLNHLKALGYLD